MAALQPEDALTKNKLGKVHIESTQNIATADYNFWLTL